MYRKANRKSQKLSPLFKLVKWLPGVLMPFRWSKTFLVDISKPNEVVLRRIRIGNLQEHCTATQGVISVTFFSLWLVCYWGVFHAWVISVSVLPNLLSVIFTYLLEIGRQYLCKKKKKLIWHFWGLFLCICENNSVFTQEFVQTGLSKHHWTVKCF